MGRFFRDLFGGGSAEPSPPKPSGARVNIRIREVGGGNVSVEGAKVKIGVRGVEQTLTTNEDGWTHFENVDLGPRHVWVEAKDYSSYDEHFEVVSPETNLTVAIRESSVSVPPSGKRTGVVRKSGHCLRDNQGEFHALGATLFWALWGYVNARPRLEKNLEYLADRGVQYVRTLCQVGPKFWEDRTITPGMARAHLKGLIQLCYGKYGLRVEPTIFGSDGFTQTDESKRQFVDDVVTICEEVKEAVAFHEIANEYYHNGILNGNYRLLRELGQIAMSKTELIVALSAPQTNGIENWQNVYKDARADAATLHLDRASSRYAEGHWRHVRQPWLEGGHGFEFLPDLLINNEPKGPMSSVSADDSSVRLQGAYITSMISQFCAYCYHTHAGIWGGGRYGRGMANIWDHPRAEQNLRLLKLANLKLPGNLPNQKRFNTGWAGHPFKNGVQHWVDGHSTGVVRAYSAGGWTYLAGVKGSTSLRSDRTQNYRIYTPGFNIYKEGRLTHGQTVTVEGGNGIGDSGDNAYIVQTW